jgi:hypothetical protein
MGQHKDDRGGNPEECQKYSILLRLTKGESLMTTLLYSLFFVLLLTGIGVAVKDSIFSRKILVSKAFPFWGASALAFLLALSTVEVDAGLMGIVKRFGNPVS